MSNDTESRISLLAHLESDLEDIRCMTGISAMLIDQHFYPTGYEIDRSRDFINFPASKSDAEYAVFAAKHARNLMEDFWIKYEAAFKSK